MTTENPHRTAAVHEADANNSGIIKYVLQGDQESILLQQIPAGCGLAFTDLIGVGPVSHLVVNGVVRSTAEVLAGLGAA